MKIIETERWVPSKEDPSRSEYIGQRTGQEVFEELRQQLENMGCLPDEYFLLDQQWEKGREIPKGADIFCTTDYGASEGIYLDVYLKWYEDGNPVTKGFITGKTLGESGDDLDNMFLISGQPMPDIFVLGKARSQPAGSSTLVQRSRKLSLTPSSHNMKSIWG